MRIQAFIFNWPGKKKISMPPSGSDRLHCETIVINSDASLNHRYPHRQHIGNDAYFTDQWNAALDRFNADVLVLIQGDVWPVKVAQVLSEGVTYIKNHGVGVYAPKC